MTGVQWLIIWVSGTATFMVGFVFGVAFGSRKLADLRAAYQHLILEHTSRSKAMYVINNAERMFVGITTRGRR